MKCPVMSDCIFPEEKHHHQKRSFKTHKKTGQMRKHLPGLSNVTIKLFQTEITERT